MVAPIFLRKLKGKNGGNKKGTSKQVLHLPKVITDLEVCVPRKKAEKNGPKT